MGGGGKKGERKKAFLYHFSRVGTFCNIERREKEGRAAVRLSLRMGGGKKKRRGVELL